MEWYGGCHFLLVDKVGLNFMCLARACMRGVWRARFFYLKASSTESLRISRAVLAIQIIDVRQLFIYYLKSSSTEKSTDYFRYQWTINKMTKQLTAKEIKALYEALPTKAHYDAINNAHAQLEKIYGDFLVKHLGYASVEEAADQGFMIIYEMQDNIKDLVHALPNHEALNEVIQYKCDEDLE